ncbi:MAG: DUF2760 domain-containing protein [Gemmataceae bacterium]|nr:DUF2760 domain-containing protein [Gemmataceae bacterium]MCI0740891.1 DUF2760 domain-containing protein [Gemmataceae bacterium]
MNDPVIVIPATIAVIVLLWFVYALATAGSLGRYFAARKIGRRWLRDPGFAAKVDELNQPPKPPEPPKPNPEPVRILTLLQREGRLFDFLLEDIQGNSNEQIGAGVREIHRKCQKALNEHLVIAHVLPDQEGDQVEVAARFDPSAIQLIGNVTGQPPFKGTLLHRGWRVQEVKLGPLPEGQDHFVIQPAEVELP